MAKTQQPDSRDWERYFDAQDERFVAALRATSPKWTVALTEFAARWSTDTRPWAREQLLAYLAQPLDGFGHNGLVKRLYKHAEKHRDDELMAAFLVAFDRLIRLTRFEYKRYNPETRAFELVRVTRARRDTMSPKNGHGSWYRRERRLYSFATRHYLRRRSWRYFRRMAFARPSDYVPAVARALVLYTNDDLASGVDLMSRWAFLHATFGKSDRLERTRDYFRVVDGKTLAGMPPAPAFPELWNRPEAAETLVELLDSASSHLVRLWARDLIRARHPDALAKFDIERLLQWLEHEDTNRGELALELLDRQPSLDRITPADWKRLLDRAQPELRERLCELIAKRVPADRLGTETCRELACRAATPVARLGLSLLKQQPIDEPMLNEHLPVLASAQSEAVGSEIATWALSHFAQADRYSADRVTPFFDSLLQPIRNVAWAWLQSGSPAATDPVLWSRLAETPHADLRCRLVDAMQAAGKPRIDPDGLVAVWTSVLLNVARGHRQKRASLEQIGAAIARDPSLAPRLLPVLAVAIRSVRSPEASVGLAIVVQLATEHDSLRPLIEQALPELELDPAMTEEVSV
jgi:hypothetical protein